MSGGKAKRLPPSEKLRVAGLVGRIKQMHKIFVLTTTIFWREIRPLGTFALAAFLLTSVLGCAVGPDYQPPRTDVPSTWNGQEVVTPELASKTVTDPVTLVAWWRSFQDPTLSSLVETAIGANLDLLQAEARIRQARAAQGVAGAGLWPTLDSSSHLPKEQRFQCHGRLRGNSFLYLRRRASGSISGRSGRFLGTGYFWRDPAQP